jgi:hypothetical protein
MWARGSYWKWRIAFKWMILDLVVGQVGEGSRGDLRPGGVGMKPPPT